jgi:uncharacterized protein YndB with AHSA1/START domain
MKSNITGRSAITIDALPEKVWEALTRPEIIKQYFFGTNAKSDWTPGSPITFTGEWEGKSYLDKGTILQVEPNRLLKYNYWGSMSGIEDKPENYSDITYELLPENDTTTLVVTQENIPTEEMRKHSEGNWNGVLRALKELLERQAVPA